MPKRDPQTTANHFGPAGLRLSARALNCLQYDGITTIQQVRMLGYAGILRMPNMGARCAKEVWQAAHSDQAERLIQQPASRYQTTPPGWDHGTCVRQVVRARNIMRAILDSDERGQGVNFHEAMDAAEAFCCDIEARYAEAMKEVPHAD